MDLSVVLPIYDEVENIVPLLDEIEAALRPTGKSFEVIAVDDGSKDGTRQLLADEVPKRPYLRVVLFRRNCGQSAAFDAGFRHASGDVVVTMDADRQNDPNDIPRLVARLDEGFDVVTGWRKNRKDGMFLRKIPSRIANWIIRRATGTQVHDLGCSLKAYRRHITDEMRLYGEMHRFISVIAENLGGRVGEVEVNHRPRVAGSSKYGLKRSVKVLLDLMTLSFLHRYHTKPIYVFGGLGLGMWLIGLLLCAVVLYQKYTIPDAWVHRNPLFIIAVLCFMVGVQLMGTGIVAEMLARTYFESQDKTAYTVATRLGFGADGATPAPDRKLKSL
jgi:glycosyltransferase involved in cell wall biosynthesis